MAQNKLEEKAYLRTIESIDADEHILCIVRQHPIGIIYLYVFTLIGLTAALFLTAVLLPTIFGSSAGTYSVFSFIALLVIIAAIIIIAVATYVYRQSHLTITDKHVIQLMQRGLFNRSVSQISLANVEDVTSEQKGVFASIFNFGVVTVETAGEQANFKFNFSSNPHRVSKIILDAKNDFLERTGQTGSARNSMRGSS